MHFFEFKFPEFRENSGDAIFNYLPINLMSMSLIRYFPHKIVPCGNPGIFGSVHSGELFSYPEAIELLALRSEDLLDVGEVLAAKNIVYLRTRAACFLKNSQVDSGQGAGSAPGRPAASRLR